MSAKVCMVGPRLPCMIEEGIVLEGFVDIVLIVRLFILKATN
jgi:hypothetical protein